jgi:hypothetical protein
MKQLISSLFFTISLLTSPLTWSDSKQISCAYKIEQLTLGALPELSSSSDPFIGNLCVLEPRVSTFLGNWFPSLPRIHFSQANRQVGDDFNQDWLFSLAIKRLGQAQFYIATQQSQRQHVLTTKEEIPFVPQNANTSSDAVMLAEQQKVRLSHKQNQIQLGFRFAYQENQPLTELSFQQITVDQPIQANVEGFEKRSLFQSTTQISRIAIISQSYHRGLNINWQFAMGLGKVSLKPENIITIEKDKNQVIALTTGLELYYQHRLNRRWFAYGRWAGEVNYWQQATTGDNFQLAPYDLITQQVNLGLGLSF